MVSCAEKQADESHGFKGLKGNIYDIKEAKDAEIVKNMKVREGINSVIDSWFTEQLKTWNEVTPAIQVRNKVEDIKMQMNRSGVDSSTPSVMKQHSVLVR